MSRIVMSGWETGDINQLGGTSSSGGPLPAVVSTSPLPRNGAYSLKLGPLSSNSGGNTFYSRLTIPHATKTETYYAFGVLRSNSGERLVSYPNNIVFSTLDTIGYVNVSLTVEADGIVRVFYCNANGGAPGNGNYVSLGISSSSIALNTWALIELHLVAATGATGTCELKVNGALQFTATSVRTCQSTANNAAIRLEYLRIDSGGPGNAASYCAVDDLRVNDTAGTINNSWPGDGAIRVLSPNGVGTTIGGTPLTGTPLSTNWQNVDEIPPNVTDYNSGSTVGTGETYALTDPTGLSVCNAINVITLASNVDGGGGGMGVTIKTPAGTSEAAVQSLTGTPTYYNRLLEVDPSDSSAWTLAKLTALEAGITVR